MEVRVLTRLLGSLVREFGWPELGEAKRRATAAPENIIRMSVNMVGSLGVAEQIMIGINSLWNDTYHDSMGQFLLFFMRKCMTVRCKSNSCVRD